MTWTAFYFAAAWVSLGLAYRWRRLVVQWRGTSERWRSMYESERDSHAVTRARLRDFEELR